MRKVENLEGQENLSTFPRWAVMACMNTWRTSMADTLRYALGTTLPETKDSDFSWERLSDPEQQ